jgi:hypothetical protein
VSVVSIGIEREWERGFECELLVEIGEGEGGWERIWKGWRGSWGE